MKEDGDSESGAQANDDEINLEDPTVQRLVRAAVELFQSSDYDFLSAVQVSRIAQLAGIPEPTARNYLKVRQLREGLIQYLLDPSSPGVTNWDDGDFAHIEDAFRDRTSQLSDDVERIINWVFEKNADDARLRSQFGMWAHLGKNDLINAGLADLYGNWYSLIRHVINEFLVTHSSEIRLRPDWLSAHDLAVIALVICEGFAMHADVYHANTSSEKFPLFTDGLPGRVFKAVLASALVFDDDQTFRTKEVFRRLDEARSEGKAGADPIVPGPRPWDVKSGEFG